VKAVIDAINRIMLKKLLQEKQLNWLFLSLILIILGLELYFISSVIVLRKTFLKN
jgi:hypothetical protein